MRRGSRATRVAVAGLTGSAMRLAAASADTNAAAGELADQAANAAGTLVARLGLVSAVELLGQAEALFRRTHPADLDYPQRMAAAALLAAAADRCASQ